MDEKTNLANSIDVSDGFTQIDRAAKRVLADKTVLAHILRGCVSEYKDCTIEEIISYIEDEPGIGDVGVHTDTSNIYGLSNEDKTITEGMIIYDVRFKAKAPSDDGYIELIINVEAQKKSNPGYSLVKRGIYYCCRLISAQKGTEFEHSEYDKIKKVYSIWICMNSTKEEMNTVTHYYIKGEDSTGVLKENPQNYDLLHLVMIRLGDDEKAKDEMLRFLDVLFSIEIEHDKKKQILNEDFGVKMSTSLEKEANVMCNIGEGYYEKGIEKGVTQGIAQGEQATNIKTIKNALAEGISFEVISRLVNLPVEEVKELAKA